MKKAFLFSFGLFVALSSLFVSCSDNNGDDDKNDSLICQISVSSTNGGSAKITNYIGSSVDVLIGNGVEVVATPNENYEFIGWFIGDSETAISTEATYTFTVEENVSLVAKFYKPFDSNGYDYVDLGLPSGIKWAAYNVGATKPEENRYYFAWGEISPKNSYNESNSVTSGLSYSELKSRSIIGSDGNLTAEYDAARANWGGDWRMPTTEEQQELINNCSWEWTTLNCINGYRVTGPNGNIIFLPAAGSRDGTLLYNEGVIGLYWSSTPCASLDDAYGLNFDSYYYGCNIDNYIRYRFRGRCVRPVLE